VAAIYLKFFDGGFAAQTALVSRMSKDWTRFCPVHKIFLPGDARCFCGTGLVDIEETIRVHMGQ
jgi:hypothetical protein